MLHEVVLLQLAVLQLTARKTAYAKCWLAVRHMTLRWAEPN